MNQAKLFEGFSQEYINKIKQQYFTGRKFRKGQLIVKEGDLGTEMFLVEMGKVSVRLGSMTANLPDQAVFGEMALLREKSARSASIMAESDVYALVLTKEAFREMRRELSIATTELLFNLCKILSERVESTNQLYLNERTQHKALKRSVGVSEEKTQEYGPKMYHFGRTCMNLPVAKPEPT